MQLFKLTSIILLAILYMSGHSEARPACLQPDTGNPEDVSIGTSHTI